uniref:F-box domain-containing protein n=1 Tax=Aegilops tauschii TaxID=37682 RepID=M8BZB6_AEGTA
MARCVCKAWHATIDDRQLLHLFPPSLAGLFITFMELPFSEFFFRPPRRDGAAAAISGNLLRYLPPMEEAIVMDHCNGLLLLFDYVVNPATQRWAPLPPLPQEVHHAVASLHRYIVFDPAVSPHYEVVIVPSITWRAIGVESQVEWPPSPCIMHVFSSAMASWEERSFTRRGGAMGTVAHLRLVTRDMHQVLSAYWGGQLYVLNQFVMRYRYIAYHHRVKINIIIIGETLNEHKYENMSQGTETPYSGKYDMIVLNEEIVRANVLTGVSLPSATHSSNMGTCGGSPAGGGGVPFVVDPCG